MLFVPIGILHKIAVDALLQHHYKQQRLAA